MTRITAKLTLLSVAVLALFFAWYAAAWQLGDMLGELTQPRSDDAVRVAETAVTLAPMDPRSRWLLGAGQRSDFTNTGITTSIVNIQHAVKLSPYNYRWWAELGRSYEQSGEDGDAEAAFKRAVSLAPEYTLPNWQLGNYYLRRGRIDDAAMPLKTAAKYSNLYRGQVFAIAWSYFGGAPDMVERFASNDASSVAGLASFYAGVLRPNDALRTWNRLSDEEKTAHQTTAAAIARQLFDQRSYLIASEFARQSGLDKAARPGAFTNGDFEGSVKEPFSFLFDWSVVRSDGKIDLSPDASVSHGGKRSLRALFRNYTKNQFFDIQQMVAVQPGTRQRVEFWLRTENLRGGSMPLFSILDGRDGKTLAVTPGFPTGTNEWQKISLEVDVPAGAEGIRIVSGREPCPTECPLIGIFWIDDFQISEIKA